MLLKLVEKGASREDSYKMVQEPAMRVWADNNLNLKDELIASEEVVRYLSKDDIENIFDNKKMLKNIDYIFARSVEVNE